MNTRPLAVGVIAAALLAASGCATVRDTLGPGWAERQDANPDTSFHLAESAWHGLNAIDMAQSFNIANSPECHSEVGFPTRQLAGEHPSKKGIMLTSLAYSLGFHWMSRWLERKDHEEGEDDGWRSLRAAWHIGGIAIKGFIVARNTAKGLTPFGHTNCN